MSIVILDKDLYKLIYSFLPVCSKIALAIVCKTTYEYFIQDRSDILKTLHGAILSYTNIFLGKFLFEKTIYDQYHTQYSVILSHNGLIPDIPLYAFRDIISLRYKRNWNSIRRETEVEGYDYRFFIKKGYILDSRFISMMTNYEILERYLYFLTRITKLSDFDFYKMFIYYDKEVRKFLGHNTVNRIWYYKDFIWRVIVLCRFHIDELGTPNELFKYIKNISNSSVTVIPKDDKFTTVHIDDLEVNISTSYIQRSLAKIKDPDIINRFNGKYNNIVPDFTSFDEGVTIIEQLK